MADSVKVKYFDPSGKAQEGYIIDNKTYKDSQGTQRVDLGSVVETAGGTYMLTKNGGVKMGTQNKSSKLAQDSILGAKELARRAIMSNYEQQALAVQNNKEKATKQYEAIVKKIKQEKKKSEANMAQILEAQGIKGGMSESSLIANNVNYENNINDLNLSLQDAMTDYDNQLLQLQKEAEYNIMMSDAKYDELYSEYLTENAKMEHEDLRAERAINSQNFIANREYDQNVYEFEKNFELALEKYLRSIFESDRAYERGVLESDRDYERGVFESDRDYERGVLESDRDYARGVLVSDRDYSIKKQQLGLSANSARNSYNNTQFNRLLESAKILSGIGDYSAMGKLFGWSDDQIDAAEDYFKLKNIK